MICRIHPITKSWCVMSKTDQLVVYILFSLLGAHLSKGTTRWLCRTRCCLWPLPHAHDNLSAREVTNIPLHCIRVISCWWLTLAIWHRTSTQPLFAEGFISTFTGVLPKKKTKFTSSWAFYMSENVGLLSSNCAFEFLWVVCFLGRWWWSSRRHV